MSIVTYDSGKTYWNETSQAFDFFTNKASQILDLIASVGSNLKVGAESRIELIEQKISSAVIPPYMIGEYNTIAYIPILIERVDRNEFIATFEEAGISFSAATEKKVIEEIKIEIIEIYELYKSEGKLGDWPKKQLAALEKYVKKTVKSS